MMLRRTLLGTGLAAALTFVVFAGQASAADPLVSGVSAVGLTVSDLDRSVDFYTKVLDFRKVSEREVYGTDYEHLEGIFGLRMRIARLQLGDEFLELTEYLVPHGRPAPPDSRSNDGWFQHVAIIVSDMDKAYARLRANKVEHASTGPQLLPETIPAAAGIRAFYFHDPDDHPIEVLNFPPDKGDAKWHRQTNQLFLGIDHSAIVVTDTDKSLAFYRDLLGMKVVGESENAGVEQEHLNNVFGARLRITSLRAGSGPGVEFLQYLAPSTGRPYPDDEKPNDLIHWQTRFEAPNVEDAMKGLLKVRSELISTGVVDLPKHEGGYSKSVLARDPDGHAVEIVQR